MLGKPLHSCHCFLVSQIRFSCWVLRSLPFLRHSDVSSLFTSSSVFFWCCCLTCYHTFDRDIRQPWDKLPSPPGSPWGAYNADQPPWGCVAPTISCWPMSATVAYLRTITKTTGSVRFQPRGLPALSIKIYPNEMVTVSSTQLLDGGDEQVKASLCGCFWAWFSAKLVLLWVMKHKRGGW